MHYLYTHRPWVYLFVPPNANLYVFNTLLPKIVEEILMSPDLHIYFITVIFWTQNAKVTLMIVPKPNWKVSMDY